MWWLLFQKWGVQSTQQDKSYSEKKTPQTLQEANYTQIVKNWIFNIWKNFGSTKIIFFLQFNKQMYFFQKVLFWKSILDTKSLKKQLFKWKLQFSENGSKSNFPLWYIKNKIRYRSGDYAKILCFSCSKKNVIKSKSCHLRGALSPLGELKK